MKTSSQHLQAEDANVPDLLVSLTDLPGSQEGREFIQEHPQLKSRKTVEYLADEVVRLLRVDLQQAEQVAETAVWLADTLEDGFSRGRSRRAAANVAHFKGEQGPAGVLYDQALKCFLDIGDEKEAAITRSSALHTLLFLGEIQRAFEWARLAGEVFEGLGDKLRLARLELNFANILFRQDRWEEAADRYEAAYREFLSLGQPEDVGVSLRNMAVCHLSLNNFRQALEYYEEARDYCLENNLPLLVVEVDYNIAYLYYLRGEHTRAIELYQLTRLRCEEVGEQYHKALCDLDQTEIFLELNLISEAVELGQRAFASFEKLGMPYESAKSLVNLGIAFGRQGKPFLTVELMDKARDIFIHEDNRIWPALIDLYEALVMYKAGRPLEAARTARKARLGLVAAALPNKAAMSDIVLARIYLDSGDFNKARGACSAALELLKPLDVPDLNCQVYFVLGQIEEAQHRFDAALVALQEAQRNLERTRNHLRVEEFKIDLLEDRLVVYEYLVELTLHRPCGESEKELILSYFEKAKTRSLADLMAFRAHTLVPKQAARSDKAEVVRKLREELNWYYRQIDLQEMRGDEKSKEEVSQLREASRRQEDDLIRTLRELHTSGKESSSLQDAAIVGLDSIRSVLPAEALIVEYFFAREVVYACVLGQNVLEVLPVTVGGRAHELLRMLQLQLSKSDLDARESAAPPVTMGLLTERCLSALYEELVAPFASLLEGHRLVIVPHGFLHYVPFHALIDRGRFLVDRFDISYAPSATAYYFSMKAKNSTSGSSLVIAATKDNDDSIATEARAVAESIPRSHLYAGSRVSPDLLNDRGRESRFIYIGTEAFPRRDNPMFSALQLGQSQISLFDLYNLRLNSEVIVLSGGGTGLGLGSGGGGDEVVGLARGLLYAGAESILMPLWQVKGQRSSGLVITSFFRALVGEGLERSEALRQAMQRVKEEYPHPYFWAPFVLIGKDTAK